MKKTYKEPLSKVIGMQQAGMICASNLGSHDSMGDDTQYSRSFIGGDEE